MADGAHLEHQLAEDVAPVAAALMSSHDAFLAPATTTGKNVAPRVAALLDVMQISDILSVEGEDTFTRPIYAGNAIATVKTKDSKKVLTVRGTAFEKAASSGGTGAVEAVDAGSAFGKSSFVSAELSKSERPELTSAKVIVSGGRAFGSNEQFHGCDEIIFYRREDVPSRVRELTGGEGVTTVFDTVGKDTFEGSLKSLKRRGVLVGCGTASGPFPPIDALQLAIQGSVYFQRPALADYIADPAERAELAGALFDHGDELPERSRSLQGRRRLRVKDRASPWCCIAWLPHHD